MPETGSLVLFSAEVELTTGQLLSLFGAADTESGAALGLVPKAVSSQPSS